MPCGVLEDAQDSAARDSTHRIPKQGEDRTGVPEGPASLASPAGPVRRPPPPVRMLTAGTSGESCSDSANTEESVPHKPVSDNNAVNAETN